MLDLKDKIILQDKIEKISKKKSKIILPTKIDFYNQFMEPIATHENEIILPGAFFIFEKLFNVEPPFNIPTINQDLLVNADESVRDFTGPRRESSVCFFTVGIGGSDDVFGGVVATQFKQKTINGMIPFRITTAGNDLSVSERDKYFMRKVDDTTGKINYYLKKFEATPQIKCVYEDGTEVPTNVWDTTNNNLINTYIEIIIKVDNKDVRQFFIDNYDITKSRINTLGLCYGYPELTSGGYIDYKGVKTMTCATFNNKDLTDDLAELNISYKIYL